MKKFMSLLAVGILVYFASLGCIPKSQSPAPVIVNQILSAYHTDKSVVLLGDRYSILLDSQTKREEMSSDLELFKKLVGQKGVYFKSYENLIVGEIRGDRVIFSLDIVIREDELEEDLLVYVNTATRKVVKEYKNSVPIFEYEKIFHREGDIYTSYASLMGKVYASDQELLAQGLALKSPLQIRLNEFEKINLNSALPVTSRPKNQDAYIDDIATIKNR